MKYEKYSIHVFIQPIVRNILPHKIMAPPPYFIINSHHRAEGKWLKLPFAELANVCMYGHADFKVYIAILYPYPPHPHTHHH